MKKKKVDFFWDYSFKKQEVCNYSLFLISYITYEEKYCCYYI